MGKLSVNVPGTPEGAPINVPPFGLVENGSEIELSEEDLDKYEAYMRYLSGDPEYEIDEDIILPEPTPEPSEENPVEEVPEPGPVSPPAEPEEG